MAHKRKSYNEGNSLPVSNHPPNKRQKTFDLGIDHNSDVSPPAIAPDSPGLKNFLAYYSAVLHGTIPEQALKAIGLSKEEVRNFEEQKVATCQVSSEKKRWEEINACYQRSIFVDHPDFETPQLRVWLKEKIDDGDINPLTPEEFDYCIERLSKKWSDERAGANKALVAFVSKAAEKHNEAAKLSKKYLETDPGKRWLLEAARFVMDSCSSVAAKLQPSDELLLFVSPRLQEIVDKFPNEPDLNQFKKKKKSLATSFMGPVHSKSKYQGQPFVPALLKTCDEGQM